MLNVLTLPIDWQSWMQRWDTQQERHLPVREQRFQIMLNTVAALCPADSIVLDLACGPRAISRRLLARLPQAQTIAVDFDPVLLKLGQEALGTAEGRLHWLKANLNESGWVAQVQALLSEMGRAHLDAVLSTTALHWLPTPRLIGIYREAAELLRPGGVLLNGDHLTYPPTLPTFRTLAQQVKDRRREEMIGQNGEDYQQWWTAVEADWLAGDPSLQPLFDEHHRNDATRDRSYNKPIGPLHLAALADAGFEEVETIWQYYDNQVLLAVRGGSVREQDCATI